MENIPNPGIESTPAPERDYDYYVDHPEQLSLDALKNTEGISVLTFINNFPARIYNKDTAAISPKRAELYSAISEAITETGFDFDFFKEKMRIRNQLLSKLNELSNKRIKQTITEEEERSRPQLIQEMDAISDELLPMIVNLYKALRQKGLKHSDLTS